LDNNQRRNKGIKDDAPELNQINSTFRFGSAKQNWKGIKNISKSFGFIKTMESEIKVGFG